MITRTDVEIEVLGEAIKAFRRSDMPKNARRVEELLGRAKNAVQQLSHQEGASKVQPPIQGSPNQGCNASRYPYN